MSKIGELRDALLHFETDLETRIKAMKQTFFARDGYVYFGDEKEHERRGGYGSRLVAVPGVETAQEVADKLNAALEPIRVRERLEAHDRIMHFHRELSYGIELASVQVRNRINGLKDEEEHAPAAAPAEPPSAAPVTTLQLAGDPAQVAEECVDDGNPNVTPNDPALQQGLAVEAAAQQAAAVAALPADYAAAFNSGIYIGLEKVAENRGETEPVSS